MAIFKIAQLLIKAGADLSIAQSAMSWKEMGPAIYAALYIEDPEWLKLLLSLGADISQRNWKGQTILHELFDTYGTDENKLALLLTSCKKGVSSTWLQLFCLLIFFLIDLVQELVLILL